MRAIIIIGLLALGLPAAAYYWEEPGEMNEYQLRLEGISGYKGYPPGVPDDPPVDHTYDVLHYDLYLDIDTVNDDFDTAVAVVKLEFTQNGVTSLGLQLTDNMAVSGVHKYDGSIKLGYTHNNDILDITLDTTYNTGDQIQIQVTYSGSPTDGVYFASNGVVHSVSWPIYAHYWFPCYDAPWDKADEGCRIELDVPTGWDAAMVGDELSDYVYEFDDPICTYNIAWNTKDSFSVYTQTGGLPSGCPEAKYSLYPEHYGNAANAFQNMPAIISHYADIYGTWPYTGTKFGIAEVPLGGGMEHPTCISIGDNFIPNSTTWEWLYAHETAHMWFGDSVGLGTWMDFWLSEGFAVYSDALWKEEHYGESAFKSRMSQFRSQYFAEDNNNRFPVYNPDIMLSATVYEKGAWVLHMMRHLYDADQDFFDMVADYYATYAHGMAITENLEAKAETHYGGQLDWFFDEWLVMAGYPEYEYIWGESKYGGKTTVNIDLEQVQTIDSLTPMFEMPIDFLVTTTEDEELITVWNDQQSQTFNIPLTIPGAITAVELDPDDWLLCTKSDTTDIELISFTASAEKSGIALEWDVGDEAGIEGYNLYRADINDAKAVNESDLVNPAKLSETKVNDVLIKGTPPYSFFDGSALPSGAYKYRLEAEYSGGGRDMGTCRNSPVNPSTFALYQSYPNPARGEVIFSFALPIAANATLELYDIRGRKIATILDEEKAPGVHKVRYGGEMADGVYLYKLTADSETAIGKMIVSR